MLIADFQIIYTEFLKTFNDKYMISAQLNKQIRGVIFII